MRIKYVVPSETPGLDSVLMLVTLLLLILLVTPLAQAEIKVIIAEATYTMGDGETPTFAEAMALNKAKQTALEEAGTYVESYTKVQNYVLTAEEIQTIAGGVLQVEVLDKKRELIGDGLRHYVKIKATVTTDKMEELAKRVKGKNVAEEYKKLKDDYTRLTRELESWKQQLSKIPSGPEREAALDQIRERENAFAITQKNEAAFFQRLVSGEIVLARGQEENGVIDDLFDKILLKGHVITLGETQIFPDSSKRDQASVVIPLTLSASQTILPAIKDTAKTLGGVFLENQFLSAGTASNNVLIDDRKYDPRSTTPIKVSLVRVSRHMEQSRYFQQRINNLALSIELEGKLGVQAQCALRNFSFDEVIGIPDSQQSIYAELIDKLIDSFNDTLEYLLSLKSGQGKLHGEVPLEKRQKEVNDFIAVIYYRLTEDKQRTVQERRNLYKQSSTLGLFTRIAPVESRLKAGGLFGIGRTSGKLSRRHEDNGFVAVLYDPATLKVEFTLPNNIAKQVESMKARIVEMKADQWERIEPDRRCRVTR